MKFSYPEARRDESVEDTYAGNKVKDPYRFLEQPQSEETQAWIEKQNKIFQEFVSQDKEQHEIIKNRLTEVVNYEKVQCPFRGGNYYYFYKNDGLQNQSVLYQIKLGEGEKLKSLEGGEVFIDPNALSAEGSVSLGSTVSSKNGKYMAYTLARSGSDWKIIYVKDADTKQDLPDKLLWCKFSSITWLHDNSGFFYTRYPAPASEFAKEGGLESEETKLGKETDKNENQTLYFHKLGTTQEEDVIVHKEPENPQHMFGSQVSHDGKYLIIYVYYSTANKNKLYYANIENVQEFLQNRKIVKLIDNFEAEYSYITNEGTKFFFKTNLNASRSKVIMIDIEKPETTVDILPEQADPLDYAICINKSYLVACYCHNVQDTLKLYTLAGEYVKDLPLPPNGSIDSLNGKKDFSDLFFKYASFTEAGSIYKYDMEDDKTISLYQTKVSNLDLSNIETKQVWYPSKDGTKIPMFIVAKKGVELNGKNPTLLYGYGGFNIALKPYFSSLRITFIQHFNGVFALANIRGGDEFGEAWHEAGIKQNKQNVFDDFQAAAEYLVKEGYTTPSKITIQGGSNGGLLVAACANQRPDLFGCVISQVPVADMLRFHKFTIGYAWCSDYGCADNAEDFEYLIKYSPVHNVKPNTKYPAVLVMTSDHDDRVVPLHSFKYVATLQHVAGDSSEQPLMIRVETKAGHGAGLPISKMIEEYADIFNFMSLTIGEKWRK